MSSSRILLSSSNLRLVSESCNDSQPLANQKTHLVLYRLLIATDHVATVRIDSSVGE